MILLTRLAVPGGDGRRAAAAAWAWPIAGLVVGTVAAIAALAMSNAPVPQAVAAGIAMVVATCLTGALHEDGLADCADGFWGASGRAERLRIMRDSRVGSYGLLALIYLVGLRWTLLTQLISVGELWAALLIPAMTSRAMMAGVMAALPFARQDGLTRHVGRPKAATAILSMAVALAASMILAGWAGLLAMLCAALAAFAVAQIARAKIGGQTGDVLGATQLLSETAALLALAALLP